MILLKSLESGEESYFWNSKVEKIREPEIKKPTFLKSKYQSKINPQEEEEEEDEETKKIKNGRPILRFIRGKLLLYF